MTRSIIIALLLFSSIASAEQIQYRATALTSLDEWVGVDTRVDGRVEKALLLVDQQPDTITVDYTVDTTAAMWRIDLMAFAANTHLGFAWSGEPASDVEWVSTSSIIDMDGWQSQNLFRYLDIEGFVLHGSSIAFTDAPEPINPGVASFEPEPWLPEAPYHAWAAENEYTYAATIQQRKYQNRAFTGVQYTEFDPAVALGSSRRLRRNCRFAGLDFCGTDGLAMSAAIAAVPEPSSLSLVLAVVAFISLTTHPREGGDARSAGRRAGYERRQRLTAHCAGCHLLRMWSCLFKLVRSVLLLWEIST